MINFINNRYSLAINKFYEHLKFLILLICLLDIQGYSLQGMEINQLNNMQKIIYIVPWSDDFSYLNETSDGTPLDAVWIRLTKAASKYGYKIKWTCDISDARNVAAVVFFDITMMYKTSEDILKYPVGKRILYAFHPPAIVPKNYDPEIKNLFHKVLTWHDDYVDNKKYFKFYWPHFTFASLASIPSFSSRKLICLFSTNHSFGEPTSYPNRKKIIQYLEKNAPLEFDLFGNRWNVKEHPCYKGFAYLPAMFDILKQYKFNICYETTKIDNGEIFERIWQTFISNCVPVYLGAPNIDTYIPSNCFIDRRKFKTEEDLLAFLRNMDEKTYIKYIANIRKFLKSSAVKKFSSEAFIEQFFSNISECESY